MAWVRTPKRHVPIDTIRRADRWAFFQVRTPQQIAETALELAGRQQSVPESQRIKDLVRTLAVPGVPKRRDKAVSFY